MYDVRLVGGFTFVAVGRDLRLFFASMSLLPSCAVMF